MHSHSAVWQREDKGKQILSPCQKFAREFSVREKCSLTTYVLVALKAGDMKKINRKQIAE